MCGGKSPPCPYHIALRWAVISIRVSSISSGIRSTNIVKKRSTLDTAYGLKPISYTNKDVTAIYFRGPGIQYLHRAHKGLPSVSQ